MLPGTVFAVYKKTLKKYLNYCCFGFEKVYNYLFCLKVNTVFKIIQ